MSERHKIKLRIEVEEMGYKRAFEAEESELHQRDFRRVVAYVATGAIQLCMGDPPDAADMVDCIVGNEPGEFMDIWRAVRWLYEAWDGIGSPAEAIKISVDIDKLSPEQPVKEFLVRRLERLGVHVERQSSERREGAAEKS